jgi:lysozyme
MFWWLAVVVLVSGIAEPSAAQTMQTQAGFISRSQIEDFGHGLGAAEGSAARPLNRVSLELIKDFEGWRAGAYDDPAGYCTIGYGHLIALTKCEGIDLGEFKTPLTPAQGEALLQRDTASARVAVQKWVTVDLNDDRFGGLVSFVYNIGKANFQRSTLLRLLNSGNYRGVPGEMRRWVSANGQVFEGLVQRRQCEGALFQGGLQLDGAGRFNRGACASLGIAGATGPLIDVTLGE